MILRVGLSAGTLRIRPVFCSVVVASATSKRKNRTCEEEDLVPTDHEQDMGSEELSQVEVSCMRAQPKSEARRKPSGV